MFYSTEDKSPLFTSEIFKMYYFDNSVNTLFSLVFTNVNKKITNEESEVIDYYKDESESEVEEEGESTMATTTSVSKGELFPLAVKVVPASSDYFNFKIDETETKVIIQNNMGVPIDVHGKLSIDNDNKTVLFSWDTNEYPIGSYIIMFWISIEYNGNKFLIKSDNLTRSIKQSSLIG